MSHAVLSHFHFFSPVSLAACCSMRDRSLHAHSSCCLMCFVCGGHPSGVGLVQFDGMQYRKDIAWRGLTALSRGVHSNHPNAAAAAPAKLPVAGIADLMHVFVNSIVFCSFSLNSVPCFPYWNRLLMPDTCAVQEMAERLQCCHSPVTPTSAPTRLQCLGSRRLVLQVPLARVAAPMALL